MQITNNLIQLTNVKCIFKYLGIIFVITLGEVYTISCFDIIVMLIRPIMQITQQLLLSVRLFLHLEDEYKIFQSQNLTVLDISAFTIGVGRRL